MSPLRARFSAFKTEFSVGDEHVPPRRGWKRYAALGLWTRGSFSFLQGGTALHWYQAAALVLQFYNSLQPGITGE